MQAAVQFLKSAGDRVKLKVLKNAIQAIRHRNAAAELVCI
jgi:hypothetical protein